MSRPPKVNHRGDVWCQACNGGRGTYRHPSEFRHDRRYRYRSYCRDCEKRHQRIAKRIRYQTDPAFRRRVLEQQHRRLRKRRNEDARAAVAAVELLGRRGLTNVAIARIVDVHPATVGRWRQRKQQPKRPQRERIFEALRATSPAV